jgi:hypothetical protein
MRTQDRHNILFQNRNPRSANCASCKNERYEQFNTRDRRPVVEGKPGSEPEDLTGRALRLRIRQQELVAELGVLALQRTSLTDLLDLPHFVKAGGLMSSGSR